MVIDVWAWPMLSERDLRLAPVERPSVVYVWRWSWMRIIGTPARFASVVPPRLAPNGVIVAPDLGCV